MNDFTSGWSAWEQAFGELPQLNSPAELHGLLTGLMIFSNPPTEVEWQAILDDLDYDATKLSTEALRLLTEEAEDMAALLAENELDLTPILPDDEHPLNERVRTLADWASGVLLGVGLMGNREYSAEDKELLSDLQNISALQYQEDDSEEHSEDDLEELIEFARLVPVSLSVGKQKQPFAQTDLGKKLAATSTSNPNALVNMFTPSDLPS